MGQKVVPLRAYSDDPGAVERVRASLDGQPLDLIFIDGGHTYEVVSGDMRRFAPLVRPGGLIAFHDISTGASSEDVPRFWAEIRDSYQHDEIIDRANGEGMGIGVLRVGDPPIRV